MKTIEEFKEYYQSIKDNIGQTIDESYSIYNFLNETNNIFGNIAEVGVYSGGSAKLINTFKNKEKILYLFDTFEGLKDVSDKDGDYLKDGFFESNYDDVLNLFKDESNVKIIKGYFPESATEEINNSTFSFIHIDTDTYQSTLNCLKYFYSRMNRGGAIIIHDYNGNSQTEGVPLAVNEFISNVPEKVETFNTTQGIIVKL